MSIKITFLGAAGCVTGSKYLVEYKNSKILIDCGMFQGRRMWREKNWDTPPLPLKEVNAVLLTHAHIDHTGILPRYVNLGLHCPVYATPATKSLASLLLPDVGSIQEQDAEYFRRKKASRHNPPKPLFTERDAIDTLQLFKSVAFNKEISIHNGIRATWSLMGHILGAAAITLQLGDKTIVFSGDIGRYDVPILVDPQAIALGDYLFIESTYGDRLHKDAHPKAELERVINETYNRGGALMIPSFAVGRAQLLLYYIRELKEEGKIPNIPVIVDSPLACDATEVYGIHPKNYDKEAHKVLKEGKHPFEPEQLAFLRDSRASKKLNDIDEPMIIIAGSGMLSGGRILHHLAHKISNPKHCLLFVGYQPPGGKGDYLQKNPKTVNLYKHEFDVRAKIETISGLSAHGDKDEMLRWCRESLSVSSENPTKVFVVHGENDSRESFAETLHTTFGWNCTLPSYMESVVL